ncbi:MAG: ATP-binding protein [Candidatus Kapaibacteriales bacterium]
MEIFTKKFAIFDAVPIGVCVIDPNFKIILWNQQLEIWTNISKSDITGKILYEAFPNLNSPKYIIPIKSVLDGGPPVIFSTQLHKNFFPSFLPDNEPRLLHTTVNSYYCFETKIRYSIISVEDYTYLSYRIQEHKKMRDKALQEVERRKVIEAELRKSEQQLREVNATKDKFFSIIAHDLKNPIGAFKNVLELLYESYNDFTKEELIEFIEPLNDSAKQLFNLLENLLLWSRAQTGRIEKNPETFNLYELIKQNINLLKLQAENKNITLTNEVNDQIEVFADMNMITTVIRNLINNAIKFTPNGGRITITAMTQNDFATVCITDTGIGMSIEDQQKLFRLDTHHTNLGTNKEKGTGLGLIICKEFVEANGGRIWVESKEGEGSRFCFTIPLRLH